MNLLKTIIFIGLGMLLVNCGGQDNSANTVKVATVENGVPKTEDGRIILSSEFESNRLTIPNGYFEGSVISKRKLEQSIADEFKSVLKVYNLVIFEKFFDFMNEKVDFHISFAIETFQHINGKKIFENVQCAAAFRQSRLTACRVDLYDCGNDLIALKDSRRTPKPAQIHCTSNIFIEDTRYNY